MKQKLSYPFRGLQRNILAGIITIGPLFVTYLIFSFSVGSPGAGGIARGEASVHIPSPGMD